jgi:uncharacterized protein
MGNNRLQSFLGTGWKFPPTFHRGMNTAEMVSGDQDIKESLRILFSTELGERLLNPQYGCSLSETIFEGMSVSLAAYIQNLVTNAITYHEPRIVVEKVTVTPQHEQGILCIIIDYFIPEANSRSNFVFTYNLNEGDLL